MPNSRMALSPGATRLQDRFVVGSGRTFNIPVIVNNRDTAEIQFDAMYRNASMESTAQKVTVAPGKSAPLFLRAVETQTGARKASSRCATPAANSRRTCYFDVRPLVPLRVRILDERGRPAAARVYLTGSDGLAYAPRGSSARIAAMSAEYFFHAEDAFEIELPAGETLIEATRGQEYRLASEKIALQPGKPAEATLRLVALDEHDGAGILVGRRPHSRQLHVAASSGHRAARRAPADLRAKI